MQTKRSVTLPDQAAHRKPELSMRSHQSPLTPETASLDHKQPTSRGGTHEVANLWVVEHFVNTAKGSLTVDDSSRCAAMSCSPGRNHHPEGCEPTQATLEGMSDANDAPLSV